MSMAVAAVAMSAVQAVGAIRAGNQQAAGLIGRAQGLESQAQFKRFEGKQESLKHKAAAVNKLQEILENMARTNAVAGAGNVDAFSGSAEQNKVRGLDVGGMDLLTIKDNEDMSIRIAAFQADQLNFAAQRARQAAGEARKSGMLNAVMALGQGAMNAAMLSGGAPTAAGMPGAAPAGGANLTGGFGGGSMGSYMPGGKMGTFGGYLG